MPAYLGQFINQEWRGGSGALFTSRNPVTNEVAWRGEAAAQAEVNAAVAAARGALEEWSFWPVEKRLTRLNIFRDMLASSCEVLAKIISLETGKPLWESKNEVTAMINKIGISMEAYRQRSAEVNKEQSNGRSITRHKPYGVAAVLGPFNFPGHLPNGHIIPALLAGNTVVFKPSELAPLVAEATMHCWEKCSLPNGVINLIQGGRETGRLLSNHPEVDALFFTGSWNTGKMLAEQFAKWPEKMLALELGGNNPLVIGEISNLKAAAYMTVQSAFLSSGQRCSCARRLIVLEGKKGDAFIKALINMMELIKVGAFTEVPEPFMGPVINGSAAAHLLAVQSALKKKGGKSLVEMRLLKVDTALLSPGLMDVSNVSGRLDEEYFGPFLQLIRVPSFEAAIQEANNTTYGLCAGLLSTSKEQYEQFYRQIKAGVINWNTPLTGASSGAPFGGVGRSGNHRPGAFYAADYCVYPVASIEATELKIPQTLTPGLTI